MQHRMDLLQILTIILIASQTLYILGYYYDLKERNGSSRVGFILRFGSLAVLFFSCLFWLYGIVETIRVVKIQAADGLSLIMFFVWIGVLFIQITSIVRILNRDGPNAYSALRKISVIKSFSICFAGLLFLTITV